jgi:hypothetical protein
MTGEQKDSEDDQGNRMTLGIAFERGQPSKGAPDEDG